MASVYHNHERLFKASKFTLILKTGYKSITHYNEKERFHSAFERSGEQVQVMVEEVKMVFLRE